MTDGLTKRCECDRTQWRKCDHAWHLAFRWQGPLLWFSLDKEARARGLELPRQYGEAKALAKIVRAEVESGTYHRPKTRAAKAAAAASFTFDEAWPKYIDSEKGHLASAEDERGRYRVYAAVTLRDGSRAGSLALVAFDEALVKELYVATIQGKAAGTRVHYRRSLKRLFKWATRQGYLEANPITEDTVMPTGKPNVRKGRCKPDVEARLLQAADESRCHDDAVRLTGILLVALDCALRIGEILAIQRRDLLWDEGACGRILIRAEREGAKKNGKSRRVPMTTRVAAWLRAWERRGPVEGRWSQVAYCYGDVTGGHIASIESAWQILVAKAHDIAITLTEHRDPDKAMQTALAAVDLDFRDLRREGALRWYHDLKYELNEVAELLGHSDLNTLKVYLGIDQDTALAAAERKMAAAGRVPAVSKPLANSRNGLRIAGGHVV